MRSGGIRQQWTYNAPPVISQFLQSDAFGRLIWGPVGSGKTTGCIVEAARRMAEQAPAADGIRYTRFAIIRQSLKDAKATVLKDVRGWFGSIADWRVSESTLYLQYGDVYSEWPFIPLDEPDDVKRLLSLQLTGAYVNECIETDINLLSDIAGRVGRYPANDQGVCSWSGIWCDTNAPILNTPWATFLRTHPLTGRCFISRLASVSTSHRAEAWMRKGISFPVHGSKLGDLKISRTLCKRQRLFSCRRTTLSASRKGRKYYERLVSVGSTDYIRRYVLS